MNIRIFLALIFLYLEVNAVSQPPHTVDSMDINIYMGLWYEIASLPGSSFHPECHCTTTEYILNPDNKSFSILNRCIIFKNNRSRIVKSKAQAFLIINPGHTKMKMQVFRPLRTDFDVVAQSPHYNWLIVSEPSGKNLRILYRDSYMPTHTYMEILQILKSQGFDIKEIVETPGNCDLIE